MDTEAEIERAEIELDQAKRRLSRLQDRKKAEEKAEWHKALSDYTVEEKCKKFDSLYEFAAEILRQVEAEGYTDDDTDHYMFEAVMELLAKDSTAFWKHYNSFL
jgi:hypothetical protein